MGVKTGGCIKSHSLELCIGKECPLHNKCFGKNKSQIAESSGSRR